MSRFRFKPILWAEDGVVGSPYSPAGTNSNQLRTTDPELPRVNEIFQNKAGDLFLHKRINGFSEYKRFYSDELEKSFRISNFASDGPYWLINDDVAIITRAESSTQYCIDIFDCVTVFNPSTREALLSITLPSNTVPKKIRAVRWNKEDSDKGMLFVHLITEGHDYYCYKIDSLNASYTSVVAISGVYEMTLLEDPDYILIMRGISSNYRRSYNVYNGNGTLKGEGYFNQNTAYRDQDIEIAEGRYDKTGDSDWLGITVFIFCKAPGGTSSNEDFLAAITFLDGEESDFTYCFNSIGVGNEFTFAPYRHSLVVLSSDLSKAYLWKDASPTNNTLQVLEIDTVSVGEILADGRSFDTPTLIPINRSSSLDETNATFDFFLIVRFSSPSGQGGRMFIGSATDFSLGFTNVPSEDNCLDSEAESSKGTEDGVINAGSMGPKRLINLLSNLVAEFKRSIKAISVTGTIGVFKNLITDSFSTVFGKFVSIVTETAKVKETLDFHIAKAIAGRIATDNVEYTQNDILISSEDYSDVVNPYTFSNSFRQDCTFVANGKRYIFIPKYGSRGAPTEWISAIIIDLETGSITKNTVHLPTSVSTSCLYFSAVYNESDNTAVICYIYNISGGYRRGKFVKLDLDSFTFGSENLYKFNQTELAFIGATEITVNGLRSAALLGLRGDGNLYIAIVDKYLEDPTDYNNCWYIVDGQHNWEYDWDTGFGPLMTVCDGNVITCCCADSSYNLHIIEISRMSDSGTTKFHLRGKYFRCWSTSNSLPLAVENNHFGKVTLHLSGSSTTSVVADLDNENALRIDSEYTSNSKIDLYDAGEFPTKSLFCTGHIVIGKDSYNTSSTAQNGISFSGNPDSTVVFSEKNFNIILSTHHIVGTKVRVVGKIGGNIVGKFSRIDSAAIFSAFANIDNLRSGLLAFEPVIIDYGTESTIPIQDKYGLKNTKVRNSVFIVRGNGWGHMQAGDFVEVWLSRETGVDTDVFNYYFEPEREAGIIIFVNETTPITTDHDMIVSGKVRSGQNIHVSVPPKGACGFLVVNNNWIQIF